MRIFAGEWVRNMMEKMGMGEGEAIESKFVSRRISAAQKKVEERHFEARKSLLEYDEVMDQQRKRVYSYRQQILEGVSCRKLVLEQIRQQISHNVDQFTNPLFGPESFARWAGSKLSCHLEPKEFRGLEIETAEHYARDLAERQAETQILDSIDENLPREEEESEWNWRHWPSSRTRVTEQTSTGIALRRLNGIESTKKSSTKHEHSSERSISLKELCF